MGLFQDLMDIRSKVCVNCGREILAMDYEKKPQHSYQYNNAIEYIKQKENYKK